jgi:GntR family transcriptional regulator
MVRGRLITTAIKGERMPGKKARRDRTEDAPGWVEHRLVSGPIPLYFQLEQILRSRIAGGEFKAEAALPSEDQICSQYGISRITVRRALAALNAQGLITRRRGVGSFLAAQQRGVQPRLTGSLSEFLATAAQLRVTILSFTEEPAPRAVADQLELTPGQPARRLLSIGALDEEGPVAHLEIWFPPDIGSLLAAAGIGEKQPVIRLVERYTGLRVARAEQVVEADTAGASAEHLGIGRETPILRVRRIYFTESGRPVELAYVHYHPQRYKYAVTFRG